MNFHLWEHRSVALPVELSCHWERCAHLIQFKCTRYSRDDFTLSVTIYNVSILFQNHPHRNMKRKFHDFRIALSRREKVYVVKKSENIYNKRVRDLDDLSFATFRCHLESCPSFSSERVKLRSDWIWTGFEST